MTSPFKYNSRSNKTKGEEGDNHVRLMKTETNIQLSSFHESKNTCKTRRSDWGSFLQMSPTPDYSIKGELQLISPQMKVRSPVEFEPAETADSFNGPARYSWSITTPSELIENRLSLLSPSHSEYNQTNEIEYFSQKAKKCPETKPGMDCFSWNTAFSVWVKFQSQLNANVVFGLSWTFLLTRCDQTNWRFHQKVIRLFVV